MGLRSAVIAAGLLGGLMATGAAAQGLDVIHDQRREGGRVCFSDHYHDGNSSGEKSKHAAEIAAMRSWESFTGWEYGSAWGHFSLAAGKGIKCEQSSGTWGCHVQARACRHR